MDSLPVRRGEAGYNLVILIVAVTVLNVLVAAMLPLWSTAIRREKEEELVFRGWQYAEAIRVFQMRFQRYPNKLEELLEVKPRSIRQLWKDPMTEDGKWALIFQGVQQPPPVQDQRNPNRGRARQEDPEEEENGRSPLGPRKGDVVQVGPIVGVHSRSREKSMLVFDGKERYDEWHFRADRFSGGARTTGIGPESKLVPELSTRWLGRPMRFVNQTPGPQLQDGSLPGEDPKQRDRRNRRNRQNPP